jgi:hypothetical protein
MSASSPQILFVLKLHQVFFFLFSVVPGKAGIWENRNTGSIRADPDIKIAKAGDAQ